MYHLNAYNTSTFIIQFIFISKGIIESIALNRQPFNWDAF